jgi:hypothetical protein
MKGDENWKKVGSSPAGVIDVKKIRYHNDKHCVPPLAVDIGG